MNAREIDSFHSSVSSSSASSSVIRLYLLQQKKSTHHLLTITKQLYVRQRTSNVNLWEEKEEEENFKWIYLRFFCCCCCCLPTIHWNSFCANIARVAYDASVIATNSQRSECRWELWNVFACETNRETRTNMVYDERSLICLSFRASPRFETKLKDDYFRITLRQVDNEKWFLLIGKRASWIVAANTGIISATYYAVIW